MSNHRGNKFYRKNEAEVMKSLGLVPTKNSGAGWIEKEDGQNDYIIAQLKSTDAKSIRILQNDINVLEYNASVSHKIPIFVIQFLNTNQVYVLAKPDDLPNISKYLNGEKVYIKSDIVEDLASNINKNKKQNKPDKVIKSTKKSREQFWEQKEKQYKWGK